MTSHPEPTGLLERAETGVDLVLERVLDVPIDDVWDSLTVSERTARWYGSWEGTPGAGSTVRVTMGFEENAPASDLTILACDAPRYLALESDGWTFDVTLRTTGDGTTLMFRHHLTTTDGLEGIGPGWEYYLDMLVSTHTEGWSPSFDDYHPSQCGYYGSLSPSAPA